MVAPAAEKVVAALGTLSTCIWRKQRLEEPERERHTVSVGRKHLKVPNVHRQSVVNKYIGNMKQNIFPYLNMVFSLASGLLF